MLGDRQITANFVKYRLTISLTGVYFCSKNILWVLVRIVPLKRFFLTNIHNLWDFLANKKKIYFFHLEIVISVTGVKDAVY